MAHPLDNPLWSALSTRHHELARGTGDVLRYPADVVPFVAAAFDGARSDEELAETSYAVGPVPHICGATAEPLGTITQMVCESPPAARADPQIEPLGDSHRAAVLALAALVYPHYFRPRTPELGRYFGIFDGNQLVAMIGERMQMPGFREISAVCTHPDHTGRGLARRLLDFVAADIAAHGDTPFLHVSPTNTRAVQLYEQNGFVTRMQIGFTKLEP